MKDIDMIFPYGIINKIVLIRTSQLESFSHLSLNEFYDECNARNLKFWEM